MNNLKFNNYQNKDLLLKASKKGFDLLDFEEVMLDDSRNFSSIKKKEIESQGKVPVIDQSELYISGYTNKYDEFEMNDSRIIFGDHTRILKFVDFPFVKGADGTKILKNKVKNVNLKYLYYYLKSIAIPNDGYSRHFKYIKNLIFPIPEYKSQNEIVEILDSMQSIIIQRKEQLQELDILIQSIFMNMFSQDITDSEVIKLSEITSHISSGSTPRGGRKVYQEEGIPIIRSQDVLMNELDLTNVAYISEEIHDNMKRSKVKNRDVLLNITGASIGRTAVYYGEDDSANKNQHVASIRLNTNKILPEFLSYYFSTDYFQEIIKLESKGGTREALNYTQIGNFDIPIPSIEKQEKFLESLERVRFIKESMEASLNEMNTLFDALMQKAFTGELV